MNPQRNRRVIQAILETLETRSLMSTVTVTNLNDSGAGSLRQAISDASAGDTISMAGLSGTIDLTSSDLTIDKSLTIDGPGRDQLAVDGQYVNRIFTISDGVSVTLDGMTLQHGYGNAYDGGAVSAVSTADGPQTLTLKDLTISSNTAGDNEAVGRGGGVFTEHEHVVVSDCVFDSNQVLTVYAEGGGMYVQNGDLTMTGTTFSNNLDDSYADGTHHGSAFGGGLYLEDVSSSTITDSTFASNTAHEENANSSGQGLLISNGGGIYATGSTVAFTNVTVAQNSAIMGDESYTSVGGGMTLVGSNYTLKNTAVAQNTADSAADLSAGTITSTFSLIGDAAGNSIVAGVNGNLVANPNFSSLADNGGATETVAISSPSPLINAGTSVGAPATDQRGYYRTGATDIGAYEYNGRNPATDHAPAFTSTANHTTATAGHAYTYHITATDADGDPITFSSSSLPAGLTLTDHGDGTADITGTPTTAGSTNIILTASDGIQNITQAYVLTIAASTTPTSTTLPHAAVSHTGTSATLSAPTESESGVKYLWKRVSKPARAANPVLSDKTGATTRVTFHKAGTYVYRLTTTSANGSSVSRDVSFTVEADATALHIVQHKQIFSSSTPTQLRAYVYDQFGNKLSTQPTFTWSLDSGDGSLNASTGLYSPESNVFSHLVLRATAGTLTGTAGDRLVA